MPKQEALKSIFEEHETKTELREMGIFVEEPNSKQDLSLALGLEEFAEFLLFEETSKCQNIICQSLNDPNDASAGALQGGCDEYAIYRLNISLDDDDDADDELETQPVIGNRLLHEFHNSPMGKRFKNILTVQKLKNYMLGLCNKMSQEIMNDYEDDHDELQRYDELKNFMFILSFGKVNGQIRHIDHIHPNIPIFLYMSHNCPSTIIYKMESTDKDDTDYNNPIENIHDLIHYWEETLEYIPSLLKTVMKESANTPLKNKKITKYFAFWETMNKTLQKFGKLYSPVALKLEIQKTKPGTAFLVGGTGNHVHAGPSSCIPRMLAFGVGVSSKSFNTKQDNHYGFQNKDQGDGELQYNLVLLHLDLCCILFRLLEDSLQSTFESLEESKVFLLKLLVTYIRQQPNDYALLLSDDRIEIRDWLDRLTRAITSSYENISLLIEEAVHSNSIFHAPGLKKSRKKIKKAALKSK